VQISAKPEKLRIKTTKPRKKEQRKNVCKVASLQNPAASDVRTQKDSTKQVARETEERKRKLTRNKTLSAGKEKLSMHGIVQLDIHEPGQRPMTMVKNNAEVEGESKPGKRFHTRKKMRGFKKRNRRPTKTRIKLKEKPTGQDTLKSQPPH